MNSISIATRGFIANSVDLSRAMRGYYDSTPVTDDAVSKTYDGFQNPYLQQALQEDEELLLLLTGFLQCH